MTVPASALSTHGSGLTASTGTHSLLPVCWFWTCLVPLPQIVLPQLVASASAISVVCQRCVMRASELNRIFVDVDEQGGGAGDTGAVQIDMDELAPTRPRGALKIKWAARLRVDHRRLDSEEEF